MSDLPMTPVWGVHELVIRSGTSPGICVLSGDKGANTTGNLPRTAERRH